MTFTIKRSQSQDAGIRHGPRSTRSRRETVRTPVVGHDVLYAAANISRAGCNASAFLIVFIFAWVIEKYARRGISKRPATWRTSTRVQYSRYARMNLIRSNCAYRDIKSCIVSRARDMISLQFYRIRKHRDLADIYILPCSLYPDLISTFP